MLRGAKTTARLSAFRSLSTLANPIEGFADIRVSQDNRSITLHSYKYPATTPEPTAINLLFHGYSEYLKCALRPYATFLASRGICSVGIDQRGFGLSEGRRGYFGSFAEIVEDSKRFLEAAREKDPQLRSKPLLLTGLSMGGASCFHFARKYPNLIKGMIAFSPAVGLVTSSIRGSIAFPKMAPFLCPFKKFGLSDFPHHLLSNNQELMNILVNDPIVYKGKFPIGSIIEFMNAGKDLIRDADKLRTPFIVFQGDADQVVDPRVVKELYEKAVNVKNKKLQLVPKGDHLLLLDPGKMEEIQREISSWLDQLL
eukprot:TRINITY_DN4426_c0_g1_i4.p1 TRINITY_DN4426_c0_g1~~TRINITY_DN4426_c0_g1_i4.p1  ORF type:complete len:312 (-),score=65.93 TRINITY_DN4426_c0_g1_i4:125-1060(-)